MLGRSGLPFFLRAASSSRKRAREARGREGGDERNRERENKTRLSSTTCGEELQKIFTDFQNLKGLWHHFYRRGGEEFFLCVHGSKKAIGEVMFLAATAWVKRGEGGDEKC